MNAVERGRRDLPIDDPAEDRDPTAVEPTSDVVAERLGRRVLETCREVLADARGVAVVGFPDHGNVGDSAIWLGQLAVLRELGLGRPRYVSGRRTYDRNTLRRRLRDGDVLLLSGGGNLGDVWPAEQRFRERVLGDFPDRRVVQLPQSIHFRRRESLERARRRLAGHPGLSLLVRDRKSLAVARDELGVDARLCPDMAFGLTPGPVAPPAEDAILWLAREDREARDGHGETPPADGDDRVVRRDWTDDEPDPRVRLSRLLREALVDHPRSLAWLWRAAARADEAAARARLERGVRLLARHRAVVTDRLHGHILALLVGRPHALLDNSYGKVSAFHRTWTRASDLAVRCEDPGEGLEVASTLAHGSEPSTRPRST